MNNSVHTIFETGKGKFKLTKNFNYTQSQEDGSVRNNCYTYIPKSAAGQNGDTEVGNFNPTVFLVFSYIDEDYQKTSKTAVWTSDKHIYRIKTVFDEIARLLLDPNSYTAYGDNAIAVKTELDEGHVILKQNGDWISLRLFISRDDQGLHPERTVAIETSKSNGFSSVLTEDEFMSLNDMIQSISFETLKQEAVVEYLLTRQQRSVANSYNKPAPSTSVKTQPKTYTKSYQNYNKPAAPVKQQSVETISAIDVSSDDEESPFPTTLNKMKDKTTVKFPDAKLPSRPASTKKAMDNLLDEAKIEDLDVDDSQAVSDIFTK